MRRKQDEEVRATVHSSMKARSVALSIIQEECGELWLGTRFRRQSRALRGLTAQRGQAKGAFHGKNAPKRTKRRIEQAGRRAFGNFTA
jgi:hypothetical protein